MLLPGQDIEPELGDADLGGAKRLLNELAPFGDAGKVEARWHVADQIGERGSPGEGLLRSVSFRQYDIAA